MPQTLIIRGIVSRAAMKVTPKTSSLTEKLSPAHKPGKQTKSASAKASWKILPDVMALLKPRRGILALGFVLMVVNRLSGLVLPASTDTLSFVPLVSDSAPPAAAEPSGSPETATVTVELLGARVEVRGAPGLAVLSDVFMALRRVRSC